MVISQKNEIDQLIDQKIDYWKKKLIDLSRRNNLISYRFTKSKSIQFISPRFSDAIDFVSLEKPIFIYKKESDFENIHNYWEASEEDEIILKKLNNLYRRSNSNFKELGVNTCFMAFGLLKYFDTDYSDSYSLAPIFLFPVQLTKHKSKLRQVHGYEIIVDIDEMMVNPALIEKLSSDYGLVLSKFQKDQGIYDYFEYLNKITINYKNWEIIHDVYLDIYSYQKYIMYEDLTANTEILKQNPLVRAYVGDRNALLGDIRETPRGAFEMANDIEVLPSDSSQKKAIELAKAGVTFVLQGPPGTGKSQTICNMIAALIENNKKVLFVSQKKAALDVVLKRLSDIGINRYCLNLHEYRGNKKEIILQLIDELNTSPYISDKHKRYKFTKYLSDQSKINSFYKELCEKREIRDLSIYNIRGFLAQLHEYKLIISNFSNIVSSDEEEYIKILDAFEYIMNILKEIDDPLNSPYYFYDKENTLMNTKELGLYIEELFDKMIIISEIIKDIKNKTQYKFINMKKLEILNNINKSLKEIINIPHFLLSPDFYGYSNEINQLYNILFKINDSKHILLADMTEKFLIRDTIKDKEIFLTTGFFGRIFRNEYKQIKKELKSLSKTKISHDKYIIILNEKESYDNLLLEHDNLKNQIQYVDKHKEYSINELNDMEYLFNYVSQLQPLYDDVRNINKSFYPLIHYITNHNPINDEIDGFNNTIKKIQRFFSSDIFYNKDVVHINKTKEELKSNINKIEHFILFKNIYTSMGEQLKDFINEYFKQNIKDPIIKVFEKAYYVQLLDHVSKNKILMSPKKEISNFKEFDFEVRNVKRYKIMDKLETRQPIYDLPGSGNERAILIREGEKKRRLKPIRQLLSEIPNLVFVLKPCFMMSPLTISQYIKAEHMKFDVVIFDEASQIMPEDAVTCLLRAKQAIILGDTQQLPPTTFFQKIQDEDYLDDNIIDLPSFLSEASIKFRNRYLNWHYRSTNENLIAFSNYYFYNNRLITFPNADQTDTSGIEFVYVDNAVYDRGKTRKNIVEAEKIVNLYLELRKKYRGKSFGIVAFGISQETAIREAFERIQIDLDESLNSTKEDLFIRNLETVQGDERDIILLSVGYGRDSRGILSYNFGPLNKEDGYKRLNVAITRSRFKTLVVCSFHPEEMDENKISTSIRYFKNYLEFAKHKDYSKFITSVGDMAFDSEFEEAVYDALNEQGFDVSSQVGCSGYRIDLAIKHPERPGEYILGIECDGAQYHSSRYARDRDKVRQQVLENLGWNIHRIWSDDWIRDRQNEINKISEKVNNITNIKKILSTDKTPDINTRKSNKFEPVVTKKVKIHKFNSKFPKYKKCTYNLPGFFLDIHTVYGRKIINYDRRLNDVLIKIINSEGPMDKELLFLRASQSIGKKRGSRIKKVINDSYKNLKRKKMIYEKDSTVHNKKIPLLVKVRISNETDRKFNQIPKEEIATAIVEILKHNFTSDLDSVKKDVSQGIYNIKRVGNQVNEKINEAIKYLLTNKIIQIETGKISLCTLKKT